MTAKKFDIVIGVNYPHRIAQNKTSQEVINWMRDNDYIKVSQRQIGLFIEEVTVVPRRTSYAMKECQQ